MINQPSLKVLVYGATGAQSSPLIKELLTKGHIPIPLTHSLEKASFFKKEGIAAVVADMNNKKRLTGISSAADVISLLIPFFLPVPEEGLVMAKNAIDAARESGIKMIVWNSSTVIPDKPIGNPSIDIRIEIAEYLKKSDVPFVILQPGLYSENLLGPWTTSYVKEQDKLAYPFPENHSVGWISATDVARITVSAFENPQIANNSYLLSGKRAFSGRELAEEFSSALSRKITYYPLPPVEFGKILDKHYGPGSGTKVAAEYQKMWDSGQFPPSVFKMENVLKDFSVEMSSMKEWISQNKTAFTN